MWHKNCRHVSASLSQWQHGSFEGINQTESSRGSCDLFIIQETDATNSSVFVSISGMREEEEEEEEKDRGMGGVKEGRMDGG